MDLDNLTQKRNRLEAKATEQIQESLNQIRGDLYKSNDYVAQQLRDLGDTPKEAEASEPTPSAPTAPKSEPLITKKPLVYFSYPMTGYNEPPTWVDPLRSILVNNGYLVYNPWDDINEQFGQQDLPFLNALPLKLVKSMCSLLCIPEETLLPFDAVWKLLHKGDGADHYGIVFQCLWFLVRSSLVVCDLIRPMAGAGVAQELLYSKQLNIPVVGLMPPSGQLNPFAHRSTTVLFSGTDLISMLPLIRGYAPQQD